MKNRNLCNSMDKNHKTNSLCGYKKDEETGVLVEFSHNLHSFHFGRVAVQTPVLPALGHHVLLKDVQQLHGYSQQWLLERLSH